MKIEIPNKLYIYYIKGKLQADISCNSYLGCWVEDGDSFLFFSEPEDELIQRVIKKFSNLSLKDCFEVDYFDWIGGRIGIYEVGGIRIIPVWERVNNLREKDILLDPGVVFGVGNHATTYNCLMAIDFIFSKKINIDTVLDLGGGTGILSLFCAARGASKVLSVDLNPRAGQTIRKSIKLNNLEHKILSVQGRAQDFLYISSDLLVANIHYDVLKDLVILMESNKYKYLVFSGIFPSQVRDIIYEMKCRGTKILRVFGDDDGWPTILGIGRGGE